MQLYQLTVWLLSYNMIMKLKRSTYELLQILSISLTDKTPLRELFDKTIFNNDKERNSSSEPLLFNFD